MKKYILLAAISALILTLTSCVSTQASQAALLEGNWETVTLTMNGEQLDVLESNMNFIPQENKFRVKGNSGMNLYYADVEVEKNKFTAYGMMNTGFQGTPDEMEYENNFFAVLMFSESFTIKDDILTIYAPEKDMVIQLKRK